MKIGIVGGTFNPIHLGHLMLGEYAYEECNLDEIWFMPNGNPPHKNIADIEVSTKERIDMLNLAIEEVAYFSLQTYEMNKKEISYSYKTLEELKALHPDDEYYFIIGSDSLFMLEHWKYPERLLKQCTIVAACRENIDMKLLEVQIAYIEEKYACSIILLRMPLLEISSSDIRKRVGVQKSIKYIVPEQVGIYIEENKLYKES